MFCIIHKWFISRRQDTGKGLPGFAARHLAKCEECRDFDRLSSSLASRLSHDAQALLRQHDSLLNERISSALDTAAGEKLLQPFKAKPRRSPLLSPLPLLAAAILVLAFVTGIIWHTILDRRPGLDPERLIGAADFDIGESSLVDIAGRVESPMAKEIAALENTMKSAAGFIKECLDIKITPTAE
jgi:hypothetical protein